MQLNQTQIQAIIPHRAPMLLVDALSLLIPGQRAVGTLYIDPAREIFRGHFPGEPVLPGVYTAEAMAQTADLLLLSTPRYAGKKPLLIGMDKVRFTRKVTPGETLELEAELLSERPEKAIATCLCRALVAGEPAASAEIVLAMR